MAYQPDLDWEDDAPPGFDTARMLKMQLGISDAAQVADTAAETATQALADAGAAQEAADEALSLVGSGGVHTVDDDVLRIYRAGTTPPDGTQPGDLVLSEAPSPQGPASIPGLMTWLDAAATGARDLGTMLPDVSGNGNDVGWWTSSTNPASVSALNGLPAFKFDQASYRRVTQETGHRTLSGVFAFTGGVPSADQTAVWCSGSLAFDIGASSTGRLFLEAEGETVYNLPLTWHGGVAYVSFVVTVDSSIRFYLSGEEVATKASTSEGDRGTLVFSRLSDPFVGVWGEFAEHQEHAASPSEVAELAAYYREKWRI